MSSIRLGMCGYFLGFVVLEVEVPETGFPEAELVDV